ncbi:hypothetical protein [Pseudogemmobacter sonorensis]|uniref:hypothetical protein n=1 Tax=Pseudogemmobacter sonorensis TaxID=2989681 RepID=UPI003F666996
MGVGSIRQMADRVAGLMEERLRIRGRGLTEKLARGGHKLPRRVRRAAALLAEASEMALTPKLQVRIDEGRVAEAYDTCLRYLGPLGRADRRKAVWLSIGASVAFSLLVVGAAVIGFLVWRGYL